MTAAVARLTRHGWVASAAVYVGAVALIGFATGATIVAAVNRPDGAGYGTALAYRDVGHVWLLAGLLAAYLLVASLQTWTTKTRGGSR